MSIFEDEKVVFAHRHFELSDRKDPQETAKLFSVPDFVGDACKAIASRVRGAVASVTFDDFHKNSARIIRTAVFGFETQETKGPDTMALPQPRDRAVFPQQRAWATESGIDATSASVASHLAGAGTQIHFRSLPGTLGSSPASPTSPSCLLPGLMCSRPIAPFCSSRWELGCALKAFCTGCSLCPELFFCT